MDVQRLRDGTLLIDLHVMDWADVVPRLANAWPVVAQGVEQFLQAKPAWDWDRLRAYTRFDSGLVWLSLDPGRPRRCATVAGIQLDCLESLYFELPHAKTDPDSFEQSHEAMSQRLFDVLRQSVLLPGPRASLSALQRWRPHSLTFVQYDDLETERTLVLPTELAGAVQP